MAISNGGYVMINAAKLPGTGYALDVKGATSANGANVRLFTPNNSDAQLVTVQDYGANQVIRFPMTGMVLDVKGAKVAQGQNVQQYTWTQGKNQQWKIVATGNQYVFDGETYDAYNVKSALNTGYELEAYGPAGDVTDGTNLDIATHAADLDHEWVFVPRNILEPSRTYRLVSAMDQGVCVGLSGKTGDYQARLMGVADDNAQRWTFVDDYPDCAIASMSLPQYYLAPEGYASASGAPVVVAKDNGDESLQWVATIVGSTSYNGQQYPLVEVTNKEGANLVLDVKGTDASVGTALRLYTRANDKSQRFLAIPENKLLDSLPAAAQLRVAYEEGGVVAANLWGNGSVPLFMSWVGETALWDARFRVRYRKATAGAETFGAWSTWRNWANRSNANQGWGAGDAYSCPSTPRRDPSGTARRYSKAIPFAVSTTGNDLAEVQLQVRRWSKSGHGPQANMTTRVKWRPTITVEGYTWSPEGLSIRYHSDQKRNNNELTIYRITCVHGGNTRVIYENPDGYPIGSLPHAGTATLPMANMDYVPAEGDNVTATIRWTNVDGAYMHAKESHTDAVSYDTGRGLVLNPTYTAPSASNGWVLHVDATGVTADSWTLYLDYGADGEAFEKYRDDDGVWDIPVKFGSTFDVYLVVRQGTKWDVWHPSTFALVKQPGLHIFNYVRSDGGRDWWVVKGNEGGPPGHQRVLARDYDAQLTNGRSLEVVHFGNATAAEEDVSGVYVPALNVAHSSDAYAERLVTDAGYAWHRSPKYPKRIRRVAVTQVTFDDTDPQYVAVSVSARRINNPTDY